MSKQPHDWSDRVSRHSYDGDNDDEQQLQLQQEHACSQNFEHTSYLRLSS